ncbi:MAG: DUF1778 domain-containing protein [Gemmatimonadetes bacterium]|nr:DUF1778 domain-containing protein [Gemmatimonadota bacterium]
MKKKRYRLPDLSRGDPSAENPPARDFTREVYEELDDRFMEHYLGLSRERIQVSSEGFSRVAAMVEQPPEPTRELKELMSKALEEESPAG